MTVCTSLANADVNVTINPSVSYQTILGWGASSWNPPWPTQALREEIINEAVNDLGLNRLRLEPPSGNRSTNRNWEWLNDNGDPDDINWAAFDTSAVDERVLQMVGLFKQRVEANGEPFDIYVSPSFFNGGSSGTVPAWLLHSPGEYAEFAIAFLLYLKNTHSIEADYYCICNEAGNGNPFTAAVVADMIKVLGPRLQALGLSTKIQFPECICADTSWNYIQAVQDDDEMWSHVGVVTYHLYGGNSARPNIRDFAWAKGLPTGQTEYMGLTMSHLYDDLTLGGVSFWEIYGLGSCFEWNYSKFGRTGQYWNFRQVMHYVRPGAVRIEANSDDANLRALAFLKNTTMTVVLINGSGARTVHVNNLSSGTYGVCQSVNAGAYQELGLQTVGGTGILTISIPSNSVLTVYPYQGTNQAPTPTDWKASPEYLIIPASSTNLSALATDPEMDTISYVWSVKSQPVGASANLTTPNGANTAATNLGVAGDYVFTVSISDPAHTVTRDVRVTVFADNQPPIPDDVHNRLPVMITLPTDTTSLRGGAWDLEGDLLTYQWSVVSQPSGAAVVLTNSTSTNCTASNMTVPGDYVFKFEVSDPTHTVSQNLTVPVYPVNNAPVISSISASPPDLALPDDSTSLSATTSDPDADMITHWWSVKSVPSGANAVFTQQGSPNTNVSGLTSVGTYVFTLTVVDRTKYTSSDVSVTVTGPSKIEGWKDFL
jgi:O-glycosyl hydrolase